MKWNHQNKKGFDVEVKMCTKHACVTFVETVQEICPIMEMQKDFLQVVENNQCGSFLSDKCDVNKRRRKKKPKKLTPTRHQYFVWTHCFLYTKQNRNFCVVVDTSHFCRPKRSHQFVSICCNYVTTSLPLFSCLSVSCLRSTGLRVHLYSQGILFTFLLALFSFTKFVFCYFVNITFCISTRKEMQGTQQGSPVTLFPQDLGVQHLQEARIKFDAYDKVSGIVSLWFQTRPLCWVRNKEDKMWRILRPRPIWSLFFIAGQKRNHRQGWAEVVVCRHVPQFPQASVPFFCEATRNSWDVLSHLFLAAVICIRENLLVCTCGVPEKATGQL